MQCRFFHFFLLVFFLCGSAAEGKEVIKIAIAKDAKETIPGQALLAMMESRLSREDKVARVSVFLEIDEETLEFEVFDAAQAKIIGCPAMISISPDQIFLNEEPLSEEDLAERMATYVRAGQLTESVPRLHLACAEETSLNRMVEVLGILYDTGVTCLLRSTHEIEESESDEVSLVQLRRIISPDVRKPVEFLAAQSISQPTLMTPESFLTEYEKALASQNWGNVAPLMHEDCTVTFSNGSTHQGKEAVRVAFERNFSLIEDEEYAISEIHWVTKEENFAVVTFVYEWSGLINGEKASGSGRGTSTVVRVGDAWLLLSEHLGPKD